MFRKEKLPYFIGAAVLIVILIVVYQKQETPRQDILNAPEPVVKTNEKGDQENKDNKSNESQKQNTQKQPVQLVIDVKGAVKKPGVYKMMGGERVVDAIRKAGGFNSQADEKQINLAQKLNDEMVVYVPAKGEEKPAVPGQTANSNENGIAGEQKINLNTATKEDLEKLPGVGPAKAEAILSYREEHGTFRSVQDLLNVTGIGDKSLEKIKEKAVVN
ncbi:competence protein ComEA [Scopulibacillus darangshiensis]|uniref:Competence protein ComEA n=1 Tax=Scopulibacillus darangshiensis TaxID=442528 RepID=A0A4R2PBB5_9BACL|nr:helix-hairpin-helix domain-containing protein [Scopulibacillus darangshiensis]TCP32322.1 competence protein ComEA [Scopulibacillus darangshiensis]